MSVGRGAVVWLGGGGHTCEEEGCGWEGDGISVKRRVGIGVLGMVCIRVQGWLDLRVQRGGRQAGRQAGPHPPRIREGARQPQRVQGSSRHQHDAHGCWGSRQAVAGRPTHTHHEAKPGSKAVAEGARQ